MSVEITIDGRKVISPPENSFECELLDLRMEYLCELKPHMEKELNRFIGERNTAELRGAMKQVAQAISDHFWSESSKWKWFHRPVIDISTLTGNPTTIQWELIGGLRHD